MRKREPGVYILQSSKNERYYIGSTDILQKRLEEHSRGMVKATRFITPLELKAFISCNTLTEARKAEYRLKQYKRRDILKKVVFDKKFPWKLRAGA